ncbi:MAG: hypothetical protein AB7Q97_02075 [Gammaproteobacteria bacterium]
MNTLPMYPAHAAPAGRLRTGARGPVLFAAGLALALTITNLVASPAGQYVPAGFVTVTELRPPVRRHVADAGTVADPCSAARPELSLSYAGLLAARSAPSPAQAHVLTLRSYECRMRVA